MDLRLALRPLPPGSLVSILWTEKSLTVKMSKKRNCRLLSYRGSTLTAPTSRTLTTTIYRSIQGRRLACLDKIVVPSDTPLPIAGISRWMRAHLTTSRHVPVTRLWTQLRPGQLTLIHAVWTGTWQQLRTRCRPIPVDVHLASSLSLQSTPIRGDYRLTLAADRQQTDDLLVVIRVEASSSALPHPVRPSTILSRIRRSCCWGSSSSIWSSTIVPLYPLRLTSLRTMSTTLSFIGRQQCSGRGSSRSSQPWTHRRCSKGTTWRVSQCPTSSSQTHSRCSVQTFSAKDFSLVRAARIICLRTSPWAVCLRTTTPGAHNSRLSLTNS